jgi:hypothetical protein
VIIKVTISPYGSKQESIIAGQMVKGKFVQQKGWRVLEDEHLKVQRNYGGKTGSRTSTHYYTIDVPEDYPLIIIRRYKTDLELVVARWQHEVLYTPSNIED